MYDAHHSELLAAWGSRGAATRRSWSVPCVDPRSAGPARVEPLAWRRCRIGLWRFGLVVSWLISWLIRTSFRRLITRPKAIRAHGRSHGRASVRERLGQHEELAVVYVSLTNIITKLTTTAMTY